MIADYTLESVHGSFSAMKVSTSVYLGGSGEVTHSVEGGKRLFLPDGVVANHYAIDGIYINGRDTSDKVPYEVIDIMSTEGILHLVCAAAEYPITVEVDQHEILLLEVDGFPIDPIK